MCHISIQHERNKLLAYPFIFPDELEKLQNKEISNRAEIPLEVNVTADPSIPEEMSSSSEEVDITNRFPAFLKTSVYCEKGFVKVNGKCLRIRGMKG